MESHEIDRKRKDERIRSIKRALHELLYIFFVNSGDFRLASGMFT